jgi:hypothetical protein
MMAAVVSEQDGPEILRLAGLGEARTSAPNWSPTYETAP